jgi:hypothetical protein
MRPISFTYSQAAADADSVAAPQLLNASGAITLNGSAVVSGVANFTSSPAYVTITNDKSATVSFVVTGTKPGGVTTQTETIAFTASGTVTGSIAFATVTNVAASAATSATISVGNAVIGYTDWIPLDIYVPNQVTNISAKASGTVNYSVQYTNEDPFDRSITQLAVPHPAASLTAATGDETQFTTTLMRAVRLKVNSGTGSIRFTIVQQSTQ